MSGGIEWRLRLNWKYPYRDYGLYGALNDPQYIKDRDKLFEGNNGWWWGDGWWNGKTETPMELQRRYRKERGE